MKKLLIPFLLVLANPIFSQSAEECKYFEILTYLRTTKHVNQQIKEYSDHLIKTKDKYVEFNVSPWIDFLGIREFRNIVNPDSVGISKELITDEESFYRTYYFKSYKSRLLDSIIERNDSKLFLTFSNPIGNCLVVELLNFNTEMFRGRKFGRGVKMLFIFDTAGGIKNVLFNGLIYG